MSYRVQQPIIVRERNEYTNRIFDIVKSLLHIMNWLFLIASTMTLVAGLYLYWKFEVIQILMDVDFNPDIYIISLSVFLFVNGGIGYFALRFQSVSLLYWYLRSLAVLLMLYVPVGSVAFAFPVESCKHDKHTKEVWIALHNYFDVQFSRRLMDEIQEVFQCCGVTNGYKDWNMNFRFECAEFNSKPERCSVPLSCCKFNRGIYTDPLCGANVLNGTMMSQLEIEDVIHTKGCFDVLGDSLQKAITTLGILCFVSAFLVLMSFFLTIVLLKLVNKNPKLLQVENYFVGMRHTILSDEDLYPDIQNHPTIGPEAKASGKDLESTI